MEDVKLNTKLNDIIRSLLQIDKINTIFKINSDIKNTTIALIENKCSVEYYIEHLIRNLHHSQNKCDRLSKAVENIENQLEGFRRKRGSL